MTAPIRALLLQLLRREQRRLAAAACAAAQGFDFGIRAATKLTVVQAAIAYVESAG